MLTYLVCILCLVRIKGGEGPNRDTYRRTDTDGVTVRPQDSRRLVPTRQALLQK